jgi:hypothetical protein
MDRCETDRLLRTSQSRHSRHPATDRHADSHRHSPAGRDRRGPVKTLQGKGGEKRLRVGDFRVRFTEESGESDDASQDRENEGVLHIHTVRNRKEAYR